MSNRIEVIDNESTEVPSAAVGTESVAFKSRSSAPYDHQALMKRLQQMAGREHVKVVQVMSSSNIRNCDFLRYFPDVKALILSGAKLDSLEGISFAPRLQNLILNSDKKNQVDLAALVSASATYLRVERARAQDIAHIRASMAIRRMEVVSGELQGIGDLQGMKLEELVLVNSQHSEIRNTAAVPTLHSLSLTGCKKLKGFSDGAPYVRSIKVEACNAFDLGSIRFVPNLNSVEILKCKRPFRLSDLAVPKQLSYVMIASSALEKEAEDLSGFESLRKLWISPSPDSFIQEVSRRCPRAKVCNGKTLFIGGVRQSNMQDFYQ